ncbi:MAG: hypothetical protein ACRD9S_22410, partial [Pyrinomonadaceae bacterium]
MAFAPKRAAKQTTSADRKHGYVVLVLQGAGAAMSPSSVPSSAFGLSGSGGELIMIGNLTWEALQKCREQAQMREAAERVAR